MNIKTKDMAEAITARESLSVEGIKRETEKMFDAQPKLGGQFADLLMTVALPEALVEEAIEVACVMLKAVENAGFKLPVLSHEMFAKEQANIAAMYELIHFEEKGILESVMAGHSEPALLAYTYGEISEKDFINRHPKGQVLTAVLQSICNVISQNLVKETKQTKALRKSLKKKAQKAKKRKVALPAAFSEKKLSSIMLEFIEQVLIDKPEGYEHYSLNAALLLSQMSWNCEVEDREVSPEGVATIRQIEAHAPKLWRHFLYPNMDAVIKHLRRYKASKYADDYRFLTKTAVTPQGTIQAEWEE